MIGRILTDVITRRYKGKGQSTYCWNPFHNISNETILKNIKNILYVTVSLEIKELQNI